MLPAHSQSKTLSLEAQILAKNEGVSLDTVAPVARMRPIVELNIGHFLIGEAIFVGLDQSIIGMRERMERARSEIDGGAA